MNKPNFQALEKRSRSKMLLRIFVHLCAFSWPSLFALAGEITVAPHSYGIVTESAPKDIPLRDLKLREAGLKPGKVFALSDEIRIFKNKGVMQEAPAARIWLNETQTNAYWYFTGGKGSAEEFVLRKGQALVIATRASTNDIVVPKP